MRSLKILIFAQAIFLGSLSYAGGATSNGGDLIAAEFVRIGRQISNILNTFPEFGVDSSSFSEAVDTTIVYSTDKKLFLNGEEVSAINYPKQRKIIVSRSRWIASKDVTQTQYMFVTHEYLGIMGFDDSTYQYSSKIFQTPGPARSKFKCAIFSDTSAWKNFYLYGVQFDRSISAVVKSAEGILIGASPVGDTMSSLNIEQIMNGKMSITTVINLGLGFIVIDLPLGQPGHVFADYKEIRSQSTKTNKRKIPCELESW